MSKLLFIIISFFVHLPSIGQSSLKEIKGLPAGEIYNLHTDKKGFLWIAHNLGLSRFDGNAFTHFHHPKENNLSIFDIVEDDQGTIWCHDLSGQVFYVKDEKMQFFSGYDNTKEILFPRMVVSNNQLLITSKFGLFICDTKTFKTKYIPAPGNKITKIGSLCVIKNKVLLFGEGNNYLYNLDKPDEYLKKVKIEGYNFTKKLSRLQPEVYNDTAFLVENPAGDLYKIIFEGDMPKVAGKISAGEFINTISIVNNKLFINTKKYSLDPYSGEKITGYNISDVEMDNEGNKWYSTLEKGLFVDYLNQWEEFKFKGGNDEIITRMDRNDKYFAYGTVKGKLIIEERGQNGKTFSISLPESSGSVEFIKFLSENEVFVSGSLGLLYVNISGKGPVKMVMPITVKDVEKKGQAFLVATSSGLFKLERNKSDSIFSLEVLFNNMRTRAVAFDSSNGTILASFKDGLYKFQKDNWQEVKYNNEKIFASAIKVLNDKTYISTYNRGLIICGKKDTIIINSENGLHSNNILRTRRFNNHLWLVCPSSIQVLDLNTNQFATDINLPGLLNIQVNDVVERAGSVMVATNEKLLVTGYTKAETINPKGYVIKLNVNGRDTVVSSPSFPYNSNINLSISLPLFSDPGQLYYKYRLIGSGNSNWSIINDVNSNINFYALSSGEYIFEAKAHHPRFEEAGFEITFPFKILTPWYITWWFRFFLAACVAGIFYGLYKYRLRQLMKVDTFRRKISSDLHDDIGSTLSSINIYSTLARQEKDNHDYLNAIQDHTQGIIANLDDLVWTINPKNDLVENLVERMRSFALPVLKAKDIKCDFSFFTDGNTHQLTIEKRTNLYLAFKEMVNNLLKHSDAGGCIIRLRLKNKILLIEVEDDGKGFDASKINPYRNGLQNLRVRAVENKGEFKIESVIGKGTTCMFSVKL